ncbi:MAG: DUF2239 family protein [Rhodoferax sp.]|nr:DUF2239 family protein [Rhodoferax sp.]
MTWLNTPCTAFEGSQRIATGTLNDVAPVAKRAVDKWAASNAPMAVLIFNDATSEVIELDWRGAPDEFAARLATQAAALEVHTIDHQPAAEISSSSSPRGPGRPRLGVVAREVTLLPRHWEWLGTQSGGASVALRKLVEDASRASGVQDRVRQCRAVGYKFMSTMAGHEPGFEEASRALFAGDQAGLDAHIADWPVDVQAHLRKVLADAFYWA